MPSPIKLMNKDLPALFNRELLGSNMAGEYIQSKMLKFNFGDIYHKIVSQWEEKNDLKITFTQDLDGGRMESWYAIIARPAPKLEVTKRLKR